jgi:hypothetical protein
MKKKIVLWLEEKHVEAIASLAQQEKRTLSSAACILLDKATPLGSETDPVLVTLQGIQSQLTQLQQQVNGTFRQPPPIITKHMPTHPGAAALQKKAMTMCDEDDLL